MDTDTLPPINRIVVVHNPQSTQTEGLKQFCAELDQNNYDYEVIDTAPDISGAIENIRAFDPEETDAFAVWSGDGGYHTTGLAVARMGLPNIVEALPGGKANDSYVSQNGHASFFEIITKGKLARVHPLDVAVKAPDGTETTHGAMGYVGINGTPRAMMDLDAKREFLYDLRNDKGEFAAKRAEALICLNAVANIASVTALIDGRELEVADITLTRIDHMARDGRTHANPFEKAYRRFISPPAGRIRVAGRMALLGCGGLIGKKFEDMSELELHSHDGEPILMHIDGELREEGVSLHAESGSRVRASVSSQFINTLTVRTRLLRRAGFQF